MDAKRVAGAAARRLAVGRVTDTAGNLRGDVEHEPAAERYGEGLDAAADPEDRHVPVDRRANERDLVTVALYVQFHGVRCHDLLSRSSAQLRRIGVEAQV